MMTVAKRAQTAKPMVARWFRITVPKTGRYNQRQTRIRRGSLSSILRGRIKLASTRMSVTDRINAPGENQVGRHGSKAAFNASR
jgi:hypothetical protein